MDKYIQNIGANARKASHKLSYVTTNQKNNFLEILAKSINENQKSIIEANSLDLLEANKGNFDDAFIDRMTLSESNIKNMCNGILQVKNLEDLIGKVINIASRCAGFINKFFDGMLADTIHDPDIQAELANANQKIAAAYEAREYSKAMREIMMLADKANQYIDHHKPWVIAKQTITDDSKKELQGICTMGINLFRLLIIYLKPVLPNVASQAEDFLKIEPLQWEDVKNTLLNHQINSYEALMVRIEKENIEAMIKKSKKDLIKI